MKRSAEPIVTTHVGSLAPLQAPSMAAEPLDGAVVDNRPTGNSLAPQPWRRNGHLA
jgi:hypothetical protein